MSQSPQTENITVVIQRRGCVIHIIGRRSRKGWDVSRKDGETIRHQGHRRIKAEAIQLAEDACEPGVKTTFTIVPSS